MGDTEIGALRAKLASRERSDDYQRRRKEMDAAFSQYGIARDVTVEPVTANGVRAEWTSTPADDRDAALLYVHGGGYVIGSLDSHRHLVSEAGRAARAWALALDYRLAPEYPFPAAVEDAVSGYRYLLSRGIRPGRIAIAGDSAGGGSSSRRCWRSATPLAQPACGCASRRSMEGIGRRCRPGEGRRSDGTEGGLLEMAKLISGLDLRCRWRHQFMLISPG
jgi:hypothetical protein